MIWRTPQDGGSTGVKSRLCEHWERKGCGKVNALVQTRTLCSGFFGVAAMDERYGVVSTGNSLSAAKHGVWTGEGSYSNASGCLRG